MNRFDEQGFTLVEMLLVVLIISTLAAMIVPRFAGRSQEAKIAAATADVDASLGSALDVYEMDNGFYPTTEQGLAALLEAPVSAPVPKKWKGPYLKKKKGLSDPWGRLYVYRFPGLHNKEDYDLLSYGPDGTEGGGDDIANWEIAAAK